MLMSLVWCGCALGVVLACAEDQTVANPASRSGAAQQTAPRQKQYVVQIKLLEVDESGVETVLGTPQLKTTGGNAGLSIDHSDGRRFDFTISLHEGAGASGTPRELLPVAKLEESPSALLEKKLDRKISLKSMQQTRKELLRVVAQQVEINIAIDPESAKSVKTQLETPIDFQVENETVADVLDRIVQPLKLGYAVKHEVVLIAVAEKLLPDPEEYSVKTYEVADLVTSTSGTNVGKRDFTPVIQHIKSTAQPETWDRKGGSATIQPFNSTSSLVVRQTASGHSAVQRALEKMRQTRSQPLDE